MSGSETSIFMWNFADQNYVFHEIKSGTTQGSILGLSLYAIFVAPLFDLTDLSNFADNNFILAVHTSKLQAASEMEIKLKIITKWLTDSGLKVNKTKTESCLFFCRDTPSCQD